MEYVALIVLLALLQYVWFTLRVGAARPKYHVEAPKTEGNEAWERLFRVQQNTLEQLIIFVPAMLIFGFYLSGKWAVIPGLVFIVGRQLYSWEYVKKPSSRGPGMALTLFANATLLIGGLVALLGKLY
jgi:glutathione S-transferase